MHVCTNHSNHSNDYVSPFRQERYLEEGIVEVKLIVPKKTTRLVIRAEYSDEKGSRTVAELNASPAHSPGGKYVSVSLRTVSNKLNPFSPIHFIEQS